VNDKPGRTWKETVVAYFKIMSWHTPGGTEGKYSKHFLGEPCALTEYHAMKAYY
jgi:hypothetical protein